MRHSANSDCPAQGLTRRGFLAAAGSLIISAGTVQRALATTEIVIQAPTDGTDATGIIQAQVDSAPDGTPNSPTIVKFPVGRSQGKYRVDGQIVAMARRHLVIEGPTPQDPALIWTDKTGQDMGIVDRNGNSIRSHFKINAAVDITLRHLAVKGPNIGRDEEGDAQYVGGLVFEHGFSISGGSSDISVENCFAESVHGDGAYVGGGSSNVRISSTQLAFCGRQGIAITNADGVLIDGCRLRGVRRSAVDLEANGADWTVRNVEIADCVIDTRLVAFAAAGANEVSDVWIHHNTIERSAGSWPMVVVKRSDGGRCRNWRVEDNTRAYPTNPFFMVSFARVDGVQVHRNVARAKATHAKAIAGVEIIECGGSIDISNNDFSWSPELLLIHEADTSVDHCENRWGPDGSLTEDVCGESLAATPPPQTPDAPPAAADSAPPGETASIQPITTTPSTAVTPDNQTQPAPAPPTTQRAEAKAATPPPPASTPTTTNPITTPTSARSSSTEARDTIDSAAPTSGVPSLLSPTSVMATAVLTGLGALILLVVRRRQRLSPQSALPPAIGKAHENGPSPPRTFHQPPTQSTQTTATRGQPDPPVARSTKPEQPGGPSGRDSSTTAAGRSRVVQDSFRFATEYQSMHRASPEDIAADTDHNWRENTSP